MVTIRWRLLTDCSISLMLAMEGPDRRLWPDSMISLRLSYPILPYPIQMRVHISIVASSRDPQLSQFSLTIDRPSLSPATSPRPPCPRSSTDLRPPSPRGPQQLSYPPHYPTVSRGSSMPERWLVLWRCVRQIPRQPTRGEFSKRPLLLGYCT